jgi:hypothetical protein
MRRGLVEGKRRPAPRRNGHHRRPVRLPIACARARSDECPAPVRGAEEPWRFERRGRALPPGFSGVRGAPDARSDKSAAPAGDALEPRRVGVAGVHGASRVRPAAHPRSDELPAPVPGAMAP